MTRRTPVDPPKWALEDGVRLQSIHWRPGVYAGVGERGCKSITVQHENGQMAPVPWARVLFSDGRVDLVNLATVESVQFLEPFPADNGSEESEDTSCT